MAIGNRLIGTVAAAAALLGGTAFLGAPAEAKEFIILGDSISDNGNFYRKYGPAGEDVMDESFTELYTVDAIDPVSDGEGAFSNGLVWDEYLSGWRGADLHNYAFAGATTGYYGEPARIPIKPSDPSTWPSDINFVDGFPTFEVPTGVLSQVGQLLADLAAGDLGEDGELGEDAVAFLLAGPNNYFFGDVFPNVSNDPATVVGEIATAVGMLANDADAADGFAGAGAKTIVVMTMPNLGNLPLASILDPALNIQLGTATAIHNALLTSAMSRLRLQFDADIVVVDIFAAFNQIIGNPERFGFTNVTDSCIFVAVGSSEATLTGLCGTPGDFNPSGFFFWDMVHTTTAGHELIAEYIAATLSAHAFGFATHGSAAGGAVAMCADPLDGTWCY